MIRRDFLRNTSLAAAGLALTDWTAFAGMNNQGLQKPFTPLKAAWSINDDGSFSLIAGDLILENAYPSFNGKPIFVKSVEVSKNATGGTITYFLKDGKIKLILGSDKDSLTLASSLEMPAAPHYFYPMAFAKVKGANRYFKQGLGFAGPSGVFEIPQAPLRREKHQPDESWSHDSFMTSGFIAPSEQSVAIGSYKHDNFIQRSTISNKEYRFGLIDRHLNDEIIMYEAGFGTEEIAIKGVLEMPELHFISGIEAFSTFQQYAKNLAIANAVKFNNSTRYQWCSWYEHESDYTQEHLDDLVKGLKTIKPALPLEMLQIDDGYSDWGDWTIANKNFPEGLPHMLKTITDAGYKTGIWVGPFMVSNKSKLFKDHPEWMLKNKEGKIFTEMSSSERDVYVLDTTHPGAFEHLRTVFRTFKKWGVTYFKTDFMDWGLRDRTKFIRHDNSKTSIQHFMEVIRMIREEIGPDSFWLACISPFQPFIGLADAVRFSNDVSPKWNDVSHVNLIQEGISDHYFQQILFQNDPDTVFLRDVNSNLNSKLTKDEAYTIALFDGMLGGFITTSDRFHKITPEYLKLWRFLQPGKKQMSCRFPYWSLNKAMKVAVRDYPDGSYAVLVVNPSAETIKDTLPLTELIGTDKAHCFSWRPGESNGLGEISSLSVELKAHQSLLFYINKSNAGPAKDLGLFGIRIKGL